jgi:cytochrome P450
LPTLTKPRGPKNAPFVGNLPSFRRNPVKFLTRMAATYGDMAYYKLGPLDAYFFNHPDFVRDILVTRQGNFVKSRMLQRARVLLGEGLLTSEGQFHLRQRRMVQPAFHRDRLAGYAAIMSEYAARKREQWRAGETLDVADEMMRLTLAVVGKTLFSADVESEAGEIGSALTSVLKMFDMLMLPFSEYFEKLPFPAIKRFEKGRDTLDRIIYRMIAERRASGEDKGDLLSMLLMSQDEEATDADRTMSDKQVRDEALTLFLAGHETTANALTWTWYLLSQNPGCEARLHQEIDEVLNGRTPGFDDFPNLRYTEMVVAESMRLYPPAWGVGRMAIENFEIGGIEVPAKSICILSPYVMHRTPAYYPDPERFDPERWTPEARQARPKFSYFPFGGGARVCIGERFAWLEGVLILATLAQKWKLRLVPGHPVEILPLITLRTKHGMKMTVEAR